jgi:PAS domain S-box-containing protein
MILDRDTGGVPERFDFSADRVIRQVRDHAMFMVDRHGNVRSWNEGVREVLGWDESDWIGQTMHAGFTPEDVTAGVPERELVTAIRSGRADDNRWMQRRNGERFFAIGSVTQIRDGDGRLVAFLKVLRDGTALHQANEELQRLLAAERRRHDKSERESALLRATLDAIPDALYIGTADGISECNPQGLALLGAASLEDLKAPIDELGGRYRVRHDKGGRPVKPDELPFMRALRGEASTLETWATKATGEDVLIRGTAAPIRIGGEIVGAVAINSDMTARAQLEEQRYALARTEARLREREQEFRALVDGVRDYAIFTVSHDGLISSWHVGAQLMTGYTAEEAIGMPFANLFTPEDRAAEWPRLEMDIAARTGEFKGEGRRLRKGGELFDAAVVLTALRGPDGALMGYLKLTQDITQRKRTDAEREDMLRQAEAARADAERASRAKDEFVATISHELRTPLGAILGWAHLLERGATRADIVPRAIEAIRRNAQVQVRLIEDLLDTSRIQAGNMRLELRPVDLATVVAAAVDAALPVAAANGITLDARLEQGLHLVMGDAERLQQIVQNLLSNALKFTPRGGKVSIAARSSAQTVELAVADNGQGMEASFLQRAFDRFQQHDASSTRRHGGLGLGLAIVRDLVDLHGGQVRAESPGPGFGSTFTVALPALGSRRDDAEADAAVTTQDAASPAIGDDEQRLNGFTLLLVDDDEDGRSVAGYTLARAGARVLEAGSASEGFALWREHRPAAILCDIVMPVNDGHEFIGWVREAERAEGRHTPAAALTAFGRTQDRTRALAAGYEAHWVKPLAPHALVQGVVDLLRRTLGDTR